jgi:methionyl aminopeptidase
MIRLKSSREIDAMHRSGRILAEILDRLEEQVKVGVSTFELDRMAESWISEKKAKPAFKGYHGFPATLCTSINEQVVHGIPSKTVVLKEGDIISIDCGVVLNDYYSDAARTFGVGKVSDAAQRLMAVTEKALWLAIEKCWSGNKLGDVGFAVEDCARTAGFSVVRDYVGHGIGRNMHELPNVPNYGPPGTRMELAHGLVIAIEPMVNMGGHEVEVLDDQWTVVTKDRSLSAHFEHTVALTAQGPKVLTDSLAHPGCSVGD